MNKKKFREIPNFASEDEEREFWGTHDSSDYVDWNKAERRDFPNLPAAAKATFSGLPMALFREIVGATFRPKTKLLNLMVYSDDPFGTTQVTPIGDIADIEPGSRIFLIYVIEDPSAKGTKTGSVQILFDSTGKVVEVLGQDLLDAPLERDLIDVAKDGLSVVMQHCIAAGTTK